MFHDISRLILLGLIPLLSLFEYLKITKAKLVDYIFCLLIIGFAFGLCYFLEFNPLYLILICCTINLSLVANLFLTPPFIKHTTLKSVFGAFYIVIPFMLAQILELHSTKGYALISIMILIWVSDSCAYFVGSRIGKRKLFPSISPKKTWEGFYGAGMCVFIAAYITGSIFSVNELNFWMFFALIIWILGSLGDLIASHVKRIHSVKDSGTILPGHGGFFDRFDAFIFVLPFILLLLEYVG